MTDVTIQNNGTIVVFVLNTEEARRFVDANVQVEPYQWVCNGEHKAALAVESRYASDLIEGMKEDGLVVM